MADERLERAALQWGSLGLVALVYLTSQWIAEAVDELNTLITRFNGSVLKDRMSQLKPAGFKFPWMGIYLGLFAVVALAIVGVMLARGWKEAFPRQPALPGELGVDE